MPKLVERGKGGEGERGASAVISSSIHTVPQEYFCHLDHSGVRIDATSRPELTYGSVEYVATADYCKVTMMEHSPQANVACSIAQSHEMSLSHCSFIHVQCTYTKCN